MRERWLIDGWELTQGLVRDVQTRGGLYGAAAMVGANVNVPNRRGDRWRPKVYGPSVFILNGWFGATSRTEWEGYWDDLLRAIAHPERLLLFTRYLAGGTVRVASGEVVAVFAPTAMGNLAATFAMEVHVPDGVWRSQIPATFSTVSALTSGQQIPMAVFIGNTAPNDELAVTLTGPMVNPTVAAADGTSSFTYMGTIPAGATLTVNSATWAITGVGVAVNPAALSWTVYRYLSLPVAPPTLTPAIVLTAAGMTAASKIAVVGPLLFLC